MKEQPSDVAVVPRMRLHLWLLNQDAWLPPGQVEDLYRLARRSDTWRPTDQAH